MSSEHGSFMFGRFQTLPYVSFHLAVLVCILYNKTVIIHVPCMSFMNHSSELSNWRGLMRISKFYNLLARSGCLGILELAVGIWRGQSYVDHTLTCEVCATFR